MKRKSIWKRWPGMVILMAATILVLASGVARAETYSGKFTLPMEVHWRDNVLPPGDYTFKLDTGRPLQMMSVNGPSGTKYVFPSGWSDRNFGGRSALVLIRSGGIGIVRELHIQISGSALAAAIPSPRVYGSAAGNSGGGLVFSFKIPKGERLLAGNEPVLIQRIPITMVGM